MAAQTTSKPAEQRVENADYFAMVGRMIRAGGRRAGEADPSSLAELAALRAELDAAIVGATRQLRSDYSLAEIGDALGVSKQAVHKMCA